MKLKHLLLFVLSLVLFTSCTSKTPYTNRNQLILLSQTQELSLGEQSYKETLAQSKVITQTKEANKIKEIGTRIAKVAKRPDFNWEFTLVQNDEKNAFCLPGGKVVVYTGILSVAKNDDQLATVISHEIAHALARHGAERMSTSMIAQGVQTAGNIVLGSQGSQYTQTFNIAFGLGSQYGVLMPYGRMQENEADEIGIYLMKEAGYNLNEAIKFWENMSNGKSEGIEFFSTHPNSDTRIENIKALIKKLQNT
ncbi:MAG: M48 family metallopeptidase [Sulfurimonadaceae bacterium]|jgi:predicted Zn-dependent protease